MRRVPVFLSVIVLACFISAAARAGAGPVSAGLAGSPPSADRNALAMAPIPAPGWVFSALGGLVLLYIARRRNG